jgi:hypothetical protein
VGHKRVARKRRTTGSPFSCSLAHAVWTERAHARISALQAVSSSRTACTSETGEYLASRFLAVPAVGWEHQPCEHRVRYSISESLSIPTRRLQPGLPRDGPSETRYFRVREAQDAGENGHPQWGTGRCALSRRKLEATKCQLENLHAPMHGPVEHSTTELARPHIGLSLLQIAQKLLTSPWRTARCTAANLHVSHHHQESGAEKRNSLRGSAPDSQSSALGAELL